MDEKEVENKEFTVSLRGYDRDEVDAYLGELAEEMRQLKAGVAGAEPVQQASSGSGDAYRQVGEETSKILMAADEAGKEIRSRAQREATSIVAEARGKAEAITRQHQADRRGFEEEIQKLREARDTLATQLEDVGRRLDETIARLKTPIETPIPPVDRGTEPKAAPAPARPAPEPAKPKAEPPPSTTPKAQAAPKPATQTPRAAVAEKAPPKAEPEPPKPKAEPAPPPAPKPEAETETATQALADLLGEVRREREESRRQVDEALSGAGVATSQPSVTKQPDASSLQTRDDAIGNGPATAGRRLKRLLQEDQNYLLDRLRTHRGKGSFDESIAPVDVQLERFEGGMTDVLADAFLAGWRGSGTSETTDPKKSVSELILKQIVQPLRRDLGRIVDAGLAAADTPKAIAERASDVFRVWKGVRTELLGEGLVYAAYHQGLVEALKRKRGTKKLWVLADEQDCPRDVCKSNADAGSIELTATFPSGHQTPPAHGGCTCTLTEG